jgi:hypothetical protein
MCCFVLFTLGLGPRIALAVWWIFGEKVGAAFDGFLLPFLGLLFLPWTTLAYVLAWTDQNGVTGVDWLFVGLGLAADIMTYSARAAKGKTSYY